MTTPMCAVPYKRPHGDIVPCTFILGHSKPEHSWWALRLQDEEDVISSGQYSAQVGALLEAIAHGDLDLYLEAILAGAHERKRARRGVLLPGGRVTP